MKNFDFTEMYALDEALNERGIQHTMRQLYSGLQIVADGWDVILHEYSIGRDFGLLEVMGLPQCHDDVIGNLTANDVLDLLDGADYEDEDEDEYWEADYDDEMGFNPYEGCYDYDC